MNVSKLRVGVYQPPEIPQSFRVYAENVQRHLLDDRIETIPFGNPTDVPTNADVLWDIRSGGGNPPPGSLIGGPPLVVTVHGFAPMSLSGWEYFRSLRGLMMTRRWSRQKVARWKELGTGVSALIAVSAFTKTEAVRYTGVDEDRIRVCHHGIDVESFFPASEDQSQGYFLHVSNNEPRKNLGRVVRAFLRLRRESDVELVLKLPRHEARHYDKIDGVRVIGEMLTTQDLAVLYRRAMAFVFPSLYEGFGMPILEAMAAGCPVITSSETACPEVAGNAAILVDPRDNESLFQAMREIASQPDTRERQVAAALERVRAFDWASSARCHGQVLRDAAERR